MRRKLIAAMGLCAMGLWCSAIGRAETPAERAPADAIGFVSWAGSDTLGDKYNASHLKGLIDALDLPAFISQRLAEDLEKSAADPQKQADEKAGREWALAMAKAPTGLYFGPVDFAKADKPQPRIGIFSKIGAEKAAAFAPQMNAVIERKKKVGDPPSAASVAGDYLLLTIGELPDFAKRLSGPVAAENLATLPAFKAALGQVGAAETPPAALVYLDGPAALKMIDDAVEAKGDAAGRQNWPKAEDALGLAGLRQIAFAGNFDGPNWSSRAFIGLNAQRTGLLALLDPKPLPEEALKMISAAATWAGVTRFDGSRLLADIRDAAARIDPQTGAQKVDAALQQFYAITGVDLQKDLLDNMGDSYIYYGTPGADGHSFKNAVIASKLKDGPKTEAALSKLESMISTMIAQRAPNAPVSFKIEALPAPNDAVSVHVITLPSAAPAWAVANGTLYISTSSAGIQAAIEQAAKGPGIVENPQFAGLWKKVGHKDMSSFMFMDLPKLAEELYPLAAQGLARRQVEHPEEKTPFVLPPLAKLMPNLGPALSVFWADQDGFHMNATGPFPLSEAVSPQMVLLRVLRVLTNRYQRAAAAGATPDAAPAQKEAIP